MKTITNKTTYGETIEQQTDNKQITTNKNDKNDKNLYYILFNKYKEKIKGKNFANRMSVIREMKKTKEYNNLDFKEQDALIKNLMCV